ncbi:hypothetical protein MY092_000757 [Salmonella enterica]|uniref:hypothetical protein n=1 Tax=Salmonella enterica TaxID=28901 RepID=UPI000B6172B4|nr:hypothetical protein [Salmonella enterica]ASD88358.1 hypothetical protein LFZ16_20165 [Salmonella enterica subsp. enterica serovar India str. SA20085604]EJC4643501.1 hypothetical protein [Salmonella enterica]EKQ9927210.1 hypothetical protein [Salmonella enterica subsp. enterica serovar Panama]
MKLKDKLTMTGRRARIAYVVIIFVVLYFFMTVVKGAFIASDDSSINFVQNIHFYSKNIISATFVFPIKSLWEHIPAMPYQGEDIIGFYKVLVPPVLFFVLCMFFISDDKALRLKYKELKAQVENDLALREMRKEVGLETLPESATVDVLIRNATNDDPAWHDTWWGKVFIGVGIALIVAAIGIN